MIAGAAAAYHANRLKYLATTEAMALEAILRNCEDGERAAETPREETLQKEADLAITAMLLAE